MAVEHNQHEAHEKGTKTPDNFLVHGGRFYEQQNTQLNE
jgi:hypothetical protein